MTWFFIALGAPFLFALVNIIDKYLVSKYSTGEHTSGGLVIFSSLIGIFIAGVILLFNHNVLNISSLDKILLSITGGLYIFWVILYLYALELEDISTIVPWFSTVPIFGFILSYFLLGETLVINQIIGSIIILFGIIIISIDFIGDRKKFKLKPVIYMICASFIISLMGVIFKYVTVGGDFWVSSFWQYISLGIFGILILALVPKYRKEFINMNKLGGIKIFSINVFSEIINVVGSLLTNFALLLAPVAMVYLVGSFQPMILFFMTIIGTKLFPKIINEDISYKVLVPKSIAIGFIVLGSILIFL